MRMDARGETHRRPTTGHAAGAARLLLVTRSENAQRGGQACLARPIDGAVEIADEGLVSQMAVRVDHRMREPGAISPSNATRTGLPPSGLAARIMPFDSIPINFAGFKLKTTPTVFPTSCSAS